MRLVGAAREDDPLGVALETLGGHGARVGGVGHVEERGCVVDARGGPHDDGRMVALGQVERLLHHGEALVGRGRIEHGHLREGGEAARVLLGLRRDRARIVGQFYKHPGIDPLAICRALYNDIRAGSYVEGGSTITQQLAKNQFFTQDKKISRKVAEMFMAFEIEKVYDKDTILELYLNSIYFGNGYNSVAEACRGYFGKEPMEMNFDECTMLAGIPNAPSAYNPLVNPDLAYQRQQQVIRKMEKAGFLNK